MTKQRRNSTGTQQQETPPVHGGATPTDRVQMIAVSAYYRAEKRAFSSGQELEDWLQAEKEIESLTVRARAEG